jgi:hypothetical protein
MNFKQALKKAKALHAEVSELYKRADEFAVSAQSGHTCDTEIAYDAVRAADGLLDAKYALEDILHYFGEAS